MLAESFGLLVQTMVGADARGRSRERLFLASRALYFDAPFINFCMEHHKDVIVVVKGEQRLLLQDAEGLFSQQPPQRWVVAGPRLCDKSRFVLRDLAAEPAGSFRAAA